MQTLRIHQATESVERSEEVLRATSAVFAVLLDAESSVRGFALTGASQFLAPYEGGRALIADRIQTLQSAAWDEPDQRARIEQFQEMATERLDTMADVIALRRRSQDPEAALPLIEKGRAQMAALRGVAVQIGQAERAALEDRKHRSDRAYAVAQASAALGFGLGLVLILALYGLLRRSVRAQEAATRLLEEQQEWLRTTLASIGDGVVATDADGRVALVNPVAQGLTGWSERDARGRPLREIFRVHDEATRREIELPPARAMRDGAAAAFPGNSVLVSRSGDARPIDDSAAPIRNERGEIVGAVLVFRDVTARRRSDEELRASRDQLRERAEQLAEATRRKDEFLAMLAHELRNPLAPIENAVTLLREPELPQAQRRHMRDVIERQVRHLVRLVDDLLDVSRITRGKIELRKERLLLSAVAERALEMSRPGLETSGHELSVSATADPLFVIGDAARLSQVVSNLLNNSAKFTPSGGHIHLALAREGEQAVLRVRDDGIGIPKSMLARVFEPFVQADIRVERPHGGLGLGLSLAKRLVEMHGGTIEARSDGEGTGCEVIVRLPLAAQAASPHEVADEATGSVRRASHVAPARRRILIVDDNKDGAETLAETLDLAGYQTLVAFDGTGALDAARKFRPHFVLLDIGLPGMNGFDVARELRRMPEARDAVLIAQTGWGQEEDRRKSREAGFDLHLVKPIRLDVLERALETRRRAPASSAG